MDKILVWIKQKLPNKEFVLIKQTVVWPYIKVKICLNQTNIFFSYMHRNGYFFYLKREKKIPVLRNTRKMRELWIIPWELSISPAYGATIACFALAPWLFRHFLHQQVSPSNGPKGKFVAKTWKYGQPTSSSWKPTIGAELSLSNLLNDIFRVYPKKGIFFPRFRKKSGHFCACIRKNKVCYTGGRGWFWLVWSCARAMRGCKNTSENQPLLSCNINVYSQCSY